MPNSLLFGAIKLKWLINFSKNEIDRKYSNTTLTKTVTLDETLLTSQPLSRFLDYQGLFLRRTR
jgi:hypothetical protein